MNIYDISREANVSIATVSRVLNNKENVNEDTRERVLEVIRRNNYSPNAFARGLMLDTMKMVGILAADIADTNWAFGLSKLEQELRGNGYSAFIQGVGYNLEEIENGLNSMLNRKVDAVILAGSFFVQKNETDNRYIREAAKTVPVFLMNAEYHCPGVYSFSCDDAGMAYNGTRWLYEKGATNVIYLADFDCTCSENKRKGFYQATAEAGKNPQENLFYIPYTVNDIAGYTADFLPKIKKKGVVFDAVITEDETLAIGTVKYAVRSGLRIPEDIQILGYDNSTLSLLSEPPLSSIENCLDIMCTNCVAALVELMHERNIPTRQVYSGRICQRATTRA